MSERVVTRRELNRSLLARQHLLERVATDPADEVRALLGLQAQLPLDPYLALWSRLTGFTHDDLSSLLIDRHVARVTVMRGTIHLVTADDAVGLWPVMRSVIERSMYSNRAKSLRGRDLTPFLTEGERMLASQPATRAQLRDRIAEQWPEEDAEALSYAVVYFTPTVQVTPRGVWGQSMQATMGALTEWLGQPVDREAEAEALDETVIRYLAAFGPATPADFQAWSGLTRTRAVFERLRPQLETVRDESGRELFDVPDAPWPDANTPAPARLLPVYDNILLGHADRTRILAGNVAHTRLMPERMTFFAGPDADYGSFLVDGFRAGIYKIVPDAARVPTLTIQCFVRLSKAHLDAVVAEAERAAAFLMPGHDVPVRVLPD